MAITKKENGRQNNQKVSKKIENGSEKMENGRQKNRKAASKIKNRPLNKINGRRKIGDGRQNE
jgi:hypothetical protein